MLNRSPRSLSRQRLSYETSVLDKYHELKDPPATLRPDDSSPQRSRQLVMPRFLGLSLHGDAWSDSSTTAAEESVASGVDLPHLALSRSLSEPSPALVEPPSLERLSMHSNSTQSLPLPPHERSFSHSAQSLPTPQLDSLSVHSTSSAQQEARLQPGEKALPARPDRTSENESVAMTRDERSGRCSGPVDVDDIDPDTSDEEDELEAESTLADDGPVDVDAYIRSESRQLIEYSSSFDDESLVVDEEDLFRELEGYEEGFEPPVLAAEDLKRYATTASSVAGATSEDASTHYAWELAESRGRAMALNDTPTGKVFRFDI